MDQYSALSLIYTGEKPSRAMYQMVWYYLIGLAGFAAAHLSAYESCPFESGEARGYPCR
jgi:hypothetical protein